MCNKAQTLVIMTEVLALHYAVFWKVSKGSLEITSLFVIVILHLPSRNNVHFK